MTPSTRNSPSGGSESSFSRKQDGAPAFPARALAGPVSLSLSPRTQREQRRRPRQGLASRRLRDSAPPRRPVVLAADARRSHGHPQQIYARQLLEQLRG